LVMVFLLYLGGGLYVASLAKTVPLVSSEENEIKALKKWYLEMKGSG